MQGIGIQPAGLTGAGTGSATAAVVPPAPGQGAVYLTSRGDYVIDPATGDLGRTTSTRQRVQLALQTELATATADTSVGESKPSKIGTGFPSESKTSIRNALQPLVDDGSISVELIDTEVVRHSPGSVKRTINYTDLQNQAIDKANR